MPSALRWPDLGLLAKSWRDLLAGKFRVKLMSGLQWCGLTSMVQVEAMTEMMRDALLAESVSSASGGATV